MARKVAHEMPRVVPKSCEWIESTVLGAKSIVDEAFVTSFCEHHSVCVGRNERKKYQIVAPDPEDRVCYVSPESSECIFVYESIFTKIGGKIPFTEFEVEVLRECEIAPSQIYPNSWGFIRAYEVVCQEFGIPTSLGVFFYLFKLTKPFSKEKQQWLSFRANQGRKVLEIPGTTPFWVDEEGECRFPLSWNEEWANSRVDRKELFEVESLFVDTLSECWGGKDQNLSTRTLLTKSSCYIQDEVIGKMSGKSSAYNHFKAHLLNQSKKSSSTLKPNSGGEGSSSPSLSVPTSSSVPESESARNTSATPSPQLSVQLADNSERSMPEHPPSRKRKAAEPKYGLINGKEFDHSGFAQEYLVGGNNKISMEGVNFIKNLDFATRTCIKVAAICQAAQNKLKGSLVVPEGEVEMLRTRFKGIEAEKKVLEGEKIELSSRITTLEARLALESQSLHATKELLKKLEKEKLEGEEKYKKLYTKYKLKISHQKKLEEELQASKDLCDQFSMDGMLVVEETVANLKAQVHVLLPDFDVEQIGPDNKVVDGVIIRPEPAIDEQVNPEGIKAAGNEQAPTSEVPVVDHPTMSDPPPTPPCPEL
ncbi:hypothetical protein PIB30_090777 [Stylosanthes scabra]|uniref:Transposase (putative) gypsy type domain-containing protein n=1 Tax=Stylosanthes scabra TaxID=79078 RepID=A0ABU6SWT4_9FABA|nr:hypothetical protein [Stylosanthes scabra]